jgi:hypothetical protein
MRVVLAPQRPFHVGETITTDLANYDGNYTYGQVLKAFAEERQPLSAVSRRMPLGCAICTAM